MSNMEKELKERLMDEDPEFKVLVEEHIEFERILEELNKRPYMTPTEEMERKKIQKMKLQGKDRMEVILSRHRDK